MVEIANSSYDYDKSTEVDNSNQALLDDKSIESIREKLGELKEELRKAEENNDSGRVAQVKEEIEKIKEETSRAIGLNGKARKFSSPTDKARKSVQKEIRRAREKINKDHSIDLYRHFSGSIKTGMFCSYTPNGDISWVT
ncbi:MAG: hypothetical protein HY073_01020 [Deltaproteobacteria bacterium]|nr:hypothetical protein [Deltaproteobacteria bacterium]